MSFDYTDCSDSLKAKRRLYDKLYRRTLLFLVLVITASCVISVRQVFITTNRVDDSTAQIKQSMSCIVSIFAQPNRASITIDNIHKCTLVRK